MTELDYEILTRRAIAMRRDLRLEFANKWLTLICGAGTWFSVTLFIYMAVNGLLR